VSVIIPTYNRSEILELCLKSLEETNKKVFVEIILVDDGSNETNLQKLKNIVKKSQLEIKLFFKKNKGPASARNYALMKCRGDIVIFINDDTIVKKDFFERHIEFHEYNKNQNSALLGPFINHPKIKLEPGADWLLNKSKMHFTYPKVINVKYQLIPWYYFWTNNISIKKDFFKKNKLLFDTDFSTAAWEDVEFGWRAKNSGLRIYLDKKLIAYHYHYLNFDDIMNRFYSHGRGLYVLEKKIDYKVLPPLAKKKYRFLARLGLKLILADYTMPLIKNYLKNNNISNNLLMKILMVYQKLNGFDYQKSISE
jgi:GT2 family glycosyltransferase